MYDGLIEGSQQAASLIVLLAVLYLIVGIIRPRWAFARGRGAVVLRSFLAMFSALVLFVGVIAYTHSQPDGPHAVKGYIDDYFAEQGAPPVQPAP